MEEVTLSIYCCCFIELLIFLTETFVCSYLFVKMTKPNPSSSVQHNLYHTRCKISHLPCTTDLSLKQKKKYCFLLEGGNMYMITLYYYYMLSYYKLLS